MDRCAPDWKRQEKREEQKVEERERLQRSDVVAFVEDVNEAGGEDAATLRVALDVAFHPVLVLRFFHHDDKDLALTERHLVLVVRFAIVERTASSTCTQIPID